MENPPTNAHVPLVGPGPGRIIVGYDPLIHMPIPFSAPAYVPTKDTPIIPRKGPSITVVNLTARVGRNQPCPSGNGKKFKRSLGGPQPGAYVAARYAGVAREMPSLFSYTESNPPPTRPVGVL